MKEIRSEYGLWELSLKSADTLSLSFKTPSDRRLEIERRGRFILKITYLLSIGWLVLTLESGVEKWIFGLLMLLIIPLASALRRGPYGSNRFIPYLIEVDGMKQTVVMTDPRNAPGRSRRYSFSEVKDVSCDYPIGKFAPPSRIIFKLSDGTTIGLPPNPPDFDAAQVLSLIRERLALL